MRRITLTAGQCNDITQAKQLCESVTQSTIIADKAYDCNDFINTIVDQKSNVNIPPRSNRKQPRAYDTAIYEERYAIECFIGKIKQFKRIFSRYDKSAQSYLSFLHFVGVLIWIR